MLVQHLSLELLLVVMRSNQIGENGHEDWDPGVHKSHQLSSFRRGFRAFGQVVFLETNFSEQPEDTCAAV